MKTIHLLFLILISSHSFLKAQYGPLLLDKPGVFKVVNWGVYTNSVMYTNSGNKFTKTETDANYKKLVAVTDVIHQNPVMSNLKGFDCDATLFVGNYNPKYGYGIPCDMKFMFCGWFLTKGKEIRWTIEPPHWDILINNIRPISSGACGFDQRTSRPDRITNPKYNSQQWEIASEKVREIFCVSSKKESLGKGIDRYNGETVIIYNTDREPYWIPVTVREAFELFLGFWRLHPDQAVIDMTVKMLEEEYSGFSESERDMYAYSNLNSRPLSRIGIDPTGDPIVRANPAYWNKNLPRSAVQILSFYYPADRDFLKKEKEEMLKNDWGTYHINRFVETLDIKTLLPVIDK
jgi:hypothetical protein